MVAIIVDLDDYDIFVLVFGNWGIDKIVVDVVVSRSYIFILFIILFFWSEGTKRGITFFGLFTISA